MSVNPMGRTNPLNAPAKTSSFAGAVPSTMNRPHDKTIKAIVMRFCFFRCSSPVGTMNVAEV